MSIDAPLCNKRKEVLEKAWDNTYGGEHHILMLNNICALKKTKPYGNQISIIQNSGYGKSRMVHEQAKLVFTIPFNLRPEANAQSMHFLPLIQLSRLIHVSEFAFPPADNMVRSCLEHALDLRTVTQRHLKFFTSLFKGKMSYGSTKRILQILTCCRLGGRSIWLVFGTCSIRVLPRMPGRV